MRSRTGTLIASLLVSACGANTVEPCGTVAPAGLRVVDIAAASSHTCARFDDGSIACWGLNGLGETGGPTSRICPRPMFVSLPRGHAVALAVGHQSTSALLDDGTIVSWGALATVTREIAHADYVPFPRTEIRIERTQRIANGGAFGCAVDDSGVVWCWGRDEQGMLGRGSFVDDDATPVPVDGAVTFATVSADESSACGVERGGAVSCWGTAGVTESRAAPFRIEGITNAVEVVIAGYERCALSADRTVTCWGESRAPARIDGLADVAQLAGGGAVCALSVDGVVRCWLPPNSAPAAMSIVTERAPHLITGLPRVTRIAVGKSHACGVGDDGSVWCWGGNHYGQLGTADLVATRTPQRVVDL